LTAILAAATAPLATNSMTDLSVFAEAGFDAKAWINAACAGRPQQEPLERFLAELEMRLQVCGVASVPD
jgi:hypothetical protein